MSTEIERLLRPAEVAKKLQLATSTVYNMMHRGLIPTVKIGKSVRVRPAALMSFLERQEKNCGLKYTPEDSNGRDL